MTGKMQTYENTVHTYANQAARLLRPLLILVVVVWLIEIIDWVFFNIPERCAPRHMPLKGLRCRGPVLPGYS